MKAAVLLLSAALLLPSSSAFAALSGYWDSTKIIHAVLGRNEVGDALKQQPIESIVETDSGYRVKSRDCAVDVRVDRRNASKPGPGSFNLHVGHGRCH
jgi:hypothetical protein